ncbi:arsenate reductase/protein-tyrosine-phosphatase family protein [Nonomuraea solani]|uniref:arsenate reductase/protein-tyrosine-phosphatase family protein n=1 Tax=Nonomuraea solani TaxID=1144553 RepID=UPI000CDEAA2C|nr:protein-tyrosine-phosphatase [Nonomuraea solani]
MSGEFRILLVCTANICRSAMAEVIAKAMLHSAAFPVTTGSAGVRALVGHPMAPHAVAALDKLGLDGRAHRARPLDPVLIGSADLLLTMEAGHRAVAVGLDPRAEHKTFTLPEFAFLASGAGHRRYRSDTAERARAIVASSAERRDHRRALEVYDPYGGPPAGYETCAKTLGDALSHALGALLGPR